MPVPAFACYMFMRTRSPKSPVFGREIRDYCGWPGKTQKKWLTWLIFNGLVREEAPRRGGRFTGTRYYAVRLEEQDVNDWSPQSGTPVRKTPDGKNQDTGISARSRPEDHLPEGRTSDPYTSTTPSNSKESLTHLQVRIDDVAAGKMKEDGKSVFDDDGEAGAISWLYEKLQVAPSVAEYWFGLVPDDDELREMQETLSEAEVMLALQRATDGRINRRLTTEAGLKGYFRLIGLVAAVQEGFVDYVHNFSCELIAERFGSGEDRLNSWAWLGKTLFGLVQNDVDASAAPDVPQETTMPKCGPLVGGKYCRPDDDEIQF